MTRSCLIYHSSLVKGEAVKATHALALLVPGVRPVTIITHGPDLDRVAFRVVREEFTATVEAVVSNEHTSFTIDADVVKSNDHTTDFLVDIADFIKRTGNQTFPSASRMVSAA